MKRKTFLSTVLPAMGGLATLPTLVRGQDSREPLPGNLVKEFVGAGHNNLEKVKEMLEEVPNLLYATWDWGNGDFETALEGAGHVGNKEIAHFLIDKGARTNVFVLTMLGKTPIVKSYLEAFPAYLEARGPHGFTLLHHAKRGGEDAKQLLAYLESKGLTTTQYKIK